MAFRCKFLLAFLFVCACIQATYARNTGPTMFLPRLIDTVAYNIDATWYITSDAGVYISDATNVTKKRTLEDTVLKLAVHHGVLSINGTPCLEKKLYINPVKGVLAVNGTLYPGPLRIMSDNGATMVTQYGTSTTYQKMMLARAHMVFHAKQPPEPPPSQPMKHVDTRKRRHRRKKKVAPQEQKEQQLEQLHDLEKEEAVAIAPQERSFTVRVLLDELYDHQDEVWQLIAENGFVVVDPNKPERKLIYKAPELSVSSANGALYFNEKKFLRDQVHLIPRDGKFTFDGSTYSGTLLVMRNKKRTMLINCVPLEEYIYSVLRFESWPGWPLEVNKAFAITSRSYVISMVLNARKGTRPYHVKNTNAHQTYGGLHGVEKLKDAVMHTKGVFLAHENKPILAMFDSCCGGVIPAKVDSIDFKKAPYLARKYACTHCKTCTLYSWQTPYTLQELGQMMQRNKQPIRDIKITKKDAAGLVQQARITTADKVVELSGKQLYSLLKDIKSFYFSVRKKGELVTFKGKGYGHHLGLCQWGAREMVRNGWDYKSILQFYYPGTNFMRLQ